MLILSHSTFRTRAPGLGPSGRQLPTEVPIDYFSPEFFNSLTVRERASYMDNGVALPTAEHCQTWKQIQEWKGLTPKEFMARYGDAKLALYELPTEDELAQLADDSDNDVE